MSDFIINVEKLSAKIGDHQALCNVSLAIPHNSFVAIVGPNGAGKTTFLKILLGLIQPSAGKVKILGRQPGEVPPEWIGYVPQVKTMDRSFPAVSVELVMTGISRRWPWLHRENEYQLAMSALQHVGAAHLATRRLGRLSGGELPRILMARSIVRRPKLVMLDEPATGIDAVGEADMYRMLEGYQKESGAALIMITHDWHVATHHADFVLLLNCNQISFGSPRKALCEDHLRTAYGHIGHEHELKFLFNSND